MSKKLLFVLILVAIVFAVAVFLVIRFDVFKRNKDYKRPGYNVILISLDTLRSDHLSAYGYPKKTSPNIEKFAERSILFENSFCNACWTLPSHMSLMTSLYPKMHGVRDQQAKLSQKIKTIAELLKENGYQTAAFTAGYLVSKIFGFDRGFDIYEEEYNARRENPGQGWRLKHVAKKLFLWLEEHSMEKFFVFIHCYDTHEPFIEHTYLKEFEDSYTGRLNFLNNHASFVSSEEFAKYKDFVDGFMYINLFYSEIINKGRMELNEEDKAHIAALYDNEIRFVDHYFGKLLDKLESLGLMENTIVLVWSDHGQELLERGRIQHGGSLYDEVIGVPLIIYIPGYEESGINSTLAQGIDIAPTILDILDLPPEEGFSGISLLSTEDGENSYVIAQQKLIEAIRGHRYKLLFFKKNKTFALFNLKNDPDERNNIADAHPEIVAQMKKILFEKLDMVDLDKDMEEKLRTLGYIHKD